MAMEERPRVWMDLGKQMVEAGMAAGFGWRRQGGGRWWRRKGLGFGWSWGSAVLGAEGMGGFGWIWFLACEIIMYPTGGPSAVHCLGHGKRE